MKFSKIIFLLPILFVVGCSTESSKKKDVGFNEPNRFGGKGNFRVEALAASSTVNAEYNNYSVVTKKLFNFKACITDPLYAPVQAALRFAIIDGAGNQEIQVTDNRGCIYWSETHSFRFIDQESYIKIRRRIESRSFYSGYADVEVALNPWADGSSSVLDLRYNNLPANAEVIEMHDLSIRGQHLRSSAKSNVQLNLKSVSFDFTGLDYSNYVVTPYLGLKVAHRYQFRITPSLIRKTINRLVVPEVLNTGRMKAILVILKEDSNPQTQYTVQNVVTSAEFVGDLVYGELTGDASIKFNSIVDLTSRTIGLVTLVPLDELEGFPKVSFVGPLSPGLLRSLSLRPIKQDALALHQQYQTRMTDMDKKTVKPVELFTKHSGFKPIASINSQMNLLAISEKMIQKKTVLISEKRNFDNSLCESVYGQNPETKYLVMQCRYRPSTYLNVQVKAFAEKILTAPQHLRELTTMDEFRMTSSFSLSENSSLNVGYNMRGGVNVGFNLGGANNQDYISKDSPLSAQGWSAKQGLNAGLNFSMGADMAYSQVWRKDESSGVTASRGQTVIAEGNTYRFQATVRRCLTVFPNYEKLGKYQDLASDLGRFYCSAVTTNETRQEVYYLVNSKFGADGSVMSDNASNGSSPWRMMVRGHAMKNLFQDLASSGFFEFVLVPFRGMKTQEQLLSQFQELNPVVNSNQTEVFPGLLSE